MFLHNRMRTSIASRRFDSSFCERIHCWRRVFVFGRRCARFCARVLCAAVGEASDRAWDLGWAKRGGRGVAASSSASIRSLMSSELSCSCGSCLLFSFSRPLASLEEPELSDRTDASKEDSGALLSAELPLSAMASCRERLPLQNQPQRELLVNTPASEKHVRMEATRRTSRWCRIQAIIFTRKMRAMNLMLSTGAQCWRTNWWERIAWWEKRSRFTGNF